MRDASGNIIKTAFDGDHGPVSFSENFNDLNGSEWSYVEITQTVHGGETLLETYLVT